ncbi:Uncharacterised protein [Bordetella pertussis]|nr:Uncharacterised protein [Bordetella pertussis]CFP70287.1 Uncharacterised protein [Bordetella pertussis]
MQISFSHCMAGRLSTACALKPAPRHTSAMPSSFSAPRPA